MVRLLHFRLILAMMVMTASSWATTYYISTSGSDSNSGTSTSSPWLHAPGMSGCTSNCASKTPAAGDRFIFKGGDTWHYSASLGTKGLPWTITGGNGTSSSQIYYGVDVTWYNSNVCGSSWCRPKLDSDNVPANGGNPLMKYSVSSCGTNGAQVNGNMLNNGNQYITVDDFEMTGYCWNNTVGYLSNCYVSGTGANSTYSNLYIHGWTHTGTATYGAAAFCGPSNSVTATIDSSVVDGADSDGTSFAALVYGPPIVKNSVFRYHANGVANGGKRLENNLFEYVSEPYSYAGDYPHGNVMEWNNEAGGVNYIYNNVVRNSNAAVGLWVCPSGDFYFNNVLYGISNWSYQIAGYDSQCGASGVSTTFNNTMVGFPFGKSGASYAATLNSNLFINASTTGTPAAVLNHISTTTANATAYGFTSANNYQPTSVDCNGNLGAAGCPLGKGANLTSTCNSIPDAVAKTACLSDSTMGPSYDLTTHRVNGNARTPVLHPTSGAWDAGAFQFGSNSNQSPDPPSGLAAIVQ